VSTSGVSIKNFLKRYQIEKKRLILPEDYQDLRQFQGDQLIWCLEKHNLSVPGANVLGFGHGFDEYSRTLLVKGTNVTGLDLSIKIPIDGAGIIRGNSINMLFAEHNFDMILYLSFIEHICEPENLLKELIRLKKPGGSLFISFPPFYEPNGGHRFSPYHLLGEKTAIGLFRKRKRHVNKRWTDEPYDFQFHSYDKTFGDYGLYPMTIAKLRWHVQSLFQKTIYVNNLINAGLN